MAARHVDRRYRPFLSRAASRLAIYLSAGYRMPVGIAGGDECVQIAASALGEGLDADGEENHAADAASERSRRGEGGGIFSSDGQRELSADGVALHDSAAGDDRAFLSGLVSGAGDRPAAFYRVDVLDF